MFFLCFNKGGFVLNQLLIEISHSQAYVGNLISKSTGEELTDFLDVREQQKKLNMKHHQR